MTPTNTKVDGWIVCTSEQVENFMFHSQIFGSYEEGLYFSQKSPDYKGWQVSPVHIIRADQDMVVLTKEEFNNAIESAKQQGIDSGYKGMGGK